MYENFEHLEEGIIYGFIEDINDNEIVIDVKGVKKKYKLDLKNDVDFSNKDFIRAYIKDGKIVFIEKLDERLYKKYMKLLAKLNQ